MTTPHSEKSIGQVLTEERKKQRIVVAQVYRDTKIKEDQLRWIEENRLENFGAPYYAKGFLKIYSEYLGMNTKHILAMYRRDFENRHISRAPKVKNKKLKVKSTDTNEEVQHKDETDKGGDLFNRRRVISLSIILLLILGAFGAYRVARLALTPPSLQINSPIELAADYTGRFETVEEFISFTGQTDSGASVFINDQPLTLNSEFEFESEKFKVENNGTNIEIKAENSLGAEAKIQISVVPKIEQIEEMSITLTSKTDVQVQIKADDVIRYDQLLESEQKVTRTGERVIEITTDQPGQLAVTVNDEEFDLANGLIFENEGDEIVQR